MNLCDNVLFIGDSLSSLKLKSDSSLALAESALKSGKRVFWCEAKDITYFNQEIFIYNCLEFISVNQDIFNYKKCIEYKIPFAFFAACFVRKDPPFDEDYKNLCWVLTTQSRVKIINPAEALLSFHEKSLHWRAFSEGFLNKNNIIPTCLAHNISIVEEFCKQFSVQQKFICKPWLGHGGENISLFENKNLLLEYLRTEKIENYIIQTYLDEIVEVGDRRVIIANGKVVCDFVRIPAQGQVASNLAQGGSAIIREMTWEQNEICVNIGKFLQGKNIKFAGVDLIGLYVGEINITSPTGIRTYESLTKINTSDEIFRLLMVGV